MRHAAQLVQSVPFRWLIVLLAVLVAGFYSLEAVDACEADSLAKATFGERMHASWVDFKRAEYDDYCRHVSDWEVKRYLRQFG